MYYRLKHKNGNQYKLKIYESSTSHNSIYIEYDNSSFETDIDNYHYLIDYFINNQSAQLTEFNYDTFMREIQKDKDFELIPCDSNYEYTGNIHENLKKLSKMLKQLSQ